MARIGLVNPQLTNSTWNAPFNCTDNVVIRHALAQLAPVLELAGHTPILLDVRLMSGWDEFDQTVAREKLDFLCVTMHTCEYVPALECCRRAKIINPKIKTIVGGVHPTISPKDCFIGGHVDYVLKGEGEVTLPKLLHDPSRFQPEIWGEGPDLSRLPFENREFWPDFEKRTPHRLIDFRGRPPFIDIMAYRGCPWQCKFCCGPGEQNLYSVGYKTETKRVPNIRSRSVPHLMEELLQLHHRYKYNSIVFNDDQFIIDAQWNYDLIEAFRESGLAKKGVEFWCSIRADMICRFEDIVEGLRSVGCRTVCVGFESFSNRMLEWMHKGTTAEQNYQAAKILRKHGLEIQANFILGIPYEDGRWYMQDDLETLKAVRRIKPESASLSFFTPIPGAPFFDWCKENDLIVSEDTFETGQRDPYSDRIRGVDYDLLRSYVEWFADRPRPSIARRIRRLLHRLKASRPVLQEIDRLISFQETVYDTLRHQPLLQKTVRPVYRGIRRALGMGPTLDVWKRKSASAN